MDKGEIVLYKPQGDGVAIDVLVESETVWLTQEQMTQLFDTTKQNVSLHINNIFKEGELESDSVVKEYLTTAADGKNYSVKHYSLDVIISVGYRVKSKRKAAVKAEIYTRKASKQLQLDLAQHNAQYAPVAVHTTAVLHDRFLIIDDTVYHIGASLKDLGKKLFAFSKMEMKPSELLRKV